jgi:triosephosphate isomerase (TIM)
MKRKLVVGNWKMNGDRARNRVLLDGILEGLPAEVDGAVCVPFPYLGQVEEVVRGTALALGAQDVSEFRDGAYTGDVSANMLADLGVQYVIVGHSERRALRGEGDDEVGRKALAALDAGITPIVCVGETLLEREAGVTGDVLRRQLDAVAKVMAPQAIHRLVLAYEPVWAIGTGRAASTEQVEETLGLIRRWLGGHVDHPESVRILYGGSVKPETAESLFSLDDTDGGLIGGASLAVESFLQICQAAAKASRSSEKHSKV